jgi:NTE family protein
MKKIVIFFSWLLLTSGPAKAQHPLYRNLVMEGGGVRAFAYAGALQVLDSLHLLDSLERVGGTSAGAIQATLVAIGYKPDEIGEIAQRVPLRQFNDGSWFFPAGIRRLRRQFGWYKGDLVRDWIAALIAAKTGNALITFGQLHAKRNEEGYKDLYITGTDLTWQCLRVFSHETHPDMRIQDAVRISISIPLYYRPVLIDSAGHVYESNDTNKQLHVMADGGILGNYPLKLLV